MAEVEPTKMRLARVLREYGLHQLAEQAEFGRYDDFESESATPIFDLVRDLRARGFAKLAKRAMNGEWDATKEESDAWMEREGKRLLGDIGHG
jgi:hypothetical protein